jgi:hypothetical protein
MLAKHLTHSDARKAAALGSVRRRFQLVCLSSAIRAATVPLVDPVWTLSGSPLGAVSAATESKTRAHAIWLESG